MPILTEGWEVYINGIPHYDHVTTAAEVTTLNARPKKSSDFTSGATTVAAGDYMIFGESIGYITDACEYGYWPPGPVCPTNQSLTYINELRPAPEMQPDGCYVDGTVGIAVSGAFIFSYGDANNYNNAGVWYNNALSFELYDMDVCIGHASGGDYHRKPSLRFAF